jgi:hypothetical protein
MEDEHTCPGEKNTNNRWNLGGKLSYTPESRSLGPESPALKGEDFVRSFRTSRKFYPRPESPVLTPGVSGLAGGL